MSVQVEVRPAPAVYRLMEDTRFQDWLLQVGIMKRVQDWQEVQPVWKNGGTDEMLTSTEWVIMNRLLTNRGYIVAYAQIASSGSKDCNHYSRTNISRIRNKMENPELIFSAPMLGFGYGIGVESLRLHDQRGRLLFRLWQDLGTWIPQKELALAIYGHADDDEYRGIRTLTWKLRQELGRTKATILSFPQVPKGGYTLMEEGIAA